MSGPTIFILYVSAFIYFIQVSWVRRIFYFDDFNETAQAPQARQELQILTVGLNTFVADKRYGIDFQYPSNHRLQIKNVKKRDEGFYECQVSEKETSWNWQFSFLSLFFCAHLLRISRQISTHPPKVIQYYLEVKGTSSRLF
jgi:hypothetical protein